MRERGGRRPPMPWFKHSTLVPRRDLVLSSAAHMGVRPNSPSEGSEGGQGPAPRGSVTSLFPQAGRSLVPPMRACPPCLQNPDPNPPGYLLCETRTENTVRRHGFLLGLFPTCLQVIRDKQGNARSSFLLYCPCNYRTVPEQ